MGRTVGGLKLGGGGGRGAWDGGRGVPKAGDEEGSTGSDEMGSLMAARRGFLMAVGLEAISTVIRIIAGWRGPIGHGLAMARLGRG